MLDETGACTVREETPGWAGEACGGESHGRPNGSDAKLHGQGPRAEARAARGAPACEARECAPRDAARF